MKWNSDRRVCRALQLARIFHAYPTAGIPARPDLERSRFSRSGGRIKASEVGVQFIQRANARLGDGLDAHRLLLVLAAALLLPTQI